MANVRQVTVSFKGFTFTKDLTDDQVICETCNGVGLVVHDYPYGIEGERRTDGNPFPYNRRFVGFCPDCYAGVRKVCPHCGRPYKNRGIQRCECDGARAEREAQQAEKDREQVAKATHISFKEAITSGVEFVYSEGHDRYYSLDELDDLDDEELGSAGVLWATKPEDLSIDADNILENATEDLHEGALDSIDKSAVQELQTLLDNWCARNGKWARSYYPDYSRVIILSPEPVDAHE